MPDQPTTNLPTPDQVRSTLHEVAQFLREADHLGPETQKALADLLDELNGAIDPATAQLGHSAADLARGLHERHDTTLLAAARERLREAALRAEVEAPTATGIIQRFLDTLANLGV